MPAGILLVLCLGCVYDRGGLSIAAVDPLGRDYKVLAESVEGEECQHAPLMLPLSLKTPDVPGAVDAALRKVEGADALVNARVEHLSFYALLYNVTCVSVRGDAVDTDGVLGPAEAQ
jgi:hypothetical protein